MLSSQVFQITSIEPALPILPLVAESAKRHNLSLEVADATPFNAPFCGSEYFAQEVRMIPNSENASLPRYDDCLKEIQTIVEQNLADGYVRGC